MVHAGARSVRDGYAYVSDSNGYWRFERCRGARGRRARAAARPHPPRVVAGGADEPARADPALHRGPRPRAEATYDALLADNQRVNVGLPEPRR